ncbi:putative claudin-24 [Cyprinodon tularosa]|uniref:putative claudin-24 n=1 Tax=Cyprinodon tularosa TaxID=77115 RepID=UPI0018E220DF|nr:putative claudin-24 [Cyprinodon tularosa]
MDSPACVLELLGMLVYIGGWLCALASTILPQWLTMSTSLLPIESYDLGLWETCVVQDIGGTECRSYDSLLGLSRHLKLARILMCTAVAMALLGILVAIPGLHLINNCKNYNGHNSKMALKITGGVLGMMSGVLCLVPVSYIANLAVMHFFDETVPEVVPRWEFGDALFIGWAAGFLLFVAGLIMVSSSLCFLVEHQPEPHHQVMSFDRKLRKHLEYV